MSARTAVLIATTGVTYNVHLVTVTKEHADDHLDRRHADGAGRPAIASPSWRSQPTTAAIRRVVE